MIILPWLQGIVGVLRAPLTWLIVVVNCLFAMATFPLDHEAREKTQELLTEDFLVSNAKFYAEYLASHPEAGSSLSRKLSERFSQGKDSGSILAHFGVRDHAFMNEALSLEFRGDQIEVEKWKGRLGELQENIASYPAHIWGLSTESRGSFPWFSHSFIHSGVNHLLGNMFFLLIFGAAVEMWLGSAAFFMGYLGGGLFSAVGYILLQGDGGVPIVGASGAISGVMGMYCVRSFREKVPFLYMVLPIRGLMGMFSAPAGIAILLWALQDVTGLINTPAGLGGVAHAAHLGGFMAGVSFGFILSRLSPALPALEKKRAKVVIPENMLRELETPKPLPVPASFKKRKPSA